MNKIKFILTSDLHYKNPNNIQNIDHIRSDKTGEVSKILDIINSKHDIDFIIVPGDLTDVGSCGEIDFIKDNTCCPVMRTHENQVKLFKEEFLDKLDSTEVPTFICLGNHDTYTTSVRTNLVKTLTGKWPKNTIQGVVISRHSNLYYAKYVGGIHIICLGIYPDRNALEFLAKNITTELTIIFFHYNIEGPFSEFWTSKEKENFYNVIKHYKNNIICICVGHHHISGITNFREFTVINGAGSNFGIYEYDIASKCIYSIN